MNGRWHSILTVHLRLYNLWRWAKMNECILVPPKSLNMKSCYLFTDDPEPHWWMQMNQEQSACRLESIFTDAIYIYSTYSTYFYPTVYVIPCVGTIWKHTHTHGQWCSSSICGSLLLHSLIWSTDAATWPTLWCKLLDNVEHRNGMLWYVWN